MSRFEVEDCIREYTLKLDKDNVDRIFENFIMPEYDEEGHLISLTVATQITHHVHCYINDCDVFKTKANKLIKQIEQISPYIKNSESLAGYNYVFPEIGLAFYRSRALTEEDLVTAWFKAQSVENQKDEMQFLYFESVMITSKDYFEFMKQTKV